MHVLALALVASRAPARLPTSRPVVVMQLPFSIPWFAPSPLEEARMLRDLLVERSTDRERIDSLIDRDRIDSLIDRLASARVPCANLGAGLWRASYIRGETPRWEEAARALPFFRERNVAGQTYDTSANTVKNYGEILGPAVHFLVEGVFSEADASVRRCPKDFDVQAERGGLVIGGRPFLTTAISGPGFLTVLYIDDDIRVFESPRDSPDRWEEAGLVVVQVRDSCFDE